MIYAVVCEVMKIFWSRITHTRKKHLCQCCGRPLVYILHTLRVLAGTETLVEYCMGLKVLLTSTFGSSEVNGHWHHTYIESTDSLLLTL